MRAADTNILVRLLSRDDKHQVTVAEAFVQPGAWVSLVALAEAVWVLRKAYKLTAPELAAYIEMLLGHDKLVLQDADVVVESLKLFRQKPALGFSDCLILQIAQKAGHVPLGTFDRALGRIEGTEKLS